jgi:Holliday junction resolvase RusA-like endonuclease
MFLRFSIPGRAVPKGRPRFSKYGGVYSPKTTVEFENHVAECWVREFGETSLEGRLRVVINVHTDRHAKQDVDNLAKSVLDGMQKAGAFAQGDHQVYVLGVSKYDATENFVTWVSITDL